MNLDTTFEERNNINAQVVKSVDEASDPWGVKVTRYEIQNITVPKEILHVMEVQMESERIKRAKIAESQGKMQAQINKSLGNMGDMINRSEGEKERLINEAEGKAKEILAICKATAFGIEKVSASIKNRGGEDAVTLRIAENYIAELRKLARKNTQLILPLDLSDISSIMGIIRGILKGKEAGEK
jgi:regulator of protease activity HflC (stomatin/prohibitin superfamily)